MKRIRTFAAGCCLGLLCLQGPAFATGPQTPPPLGTGAGASRQAWAASAALSRGIRLRRGLPELPPSAGLPGWAKALDHAGFRSVALRLPEMADASSDAEAKRVDELVDRLLLRGMTVVLGLQTPPPDVGAPSPAAFASSQAAAWNAIARRYAGRSPRLLFELSLPADLPANWRNAVLAACLHAVRASNPGRVVVLGWQDAISLPELVLPDDAHLIVEIRNTEPYRFTRQGLPGIAESATWVGSGCCTPRERQLMALPLDLAKKWSVERRYPVWLGEFGSSLSIAADLRARHAGLVRDEAEARGFSWAYGDSNDDFGLGGGPSPAWQRPLLKALLGTD